MSLMTTLEYVVRRQKFKLCLIGTLCVCARSPRHVNERALTKFRLV